MDDNIFLNSRYHSMNVQLVCNADIKFTNVVAKNPGSTHGAFIFHTSENWQEMEDGADEWLLGAYMVSHVQHNK